MKNLAFLFVTVAMLVSCSDNLVENNTTVDRQIKAKSITVNKVIGSRLEVCSEELSLATVYDLNTHEIIGSQMLRRSIKTIELGSRETSEYGTFTVKANAVKPATTIATRGEELFIVTTKRIIVNSTISNGEVEFNPEYVLEYEECSWSNGDTTIVFPCTWEVNDECVTMNAEGRVTDEITTNFCNEYVQKANEIGTLNKNIPAVEEKRFALGAQFTVTLDPDNAKNWLVGISIATADSTKTLVLALDKNAEIIATRLCDGASAANNGAYYIKGKGWCPAHAADKNNGMEWGVGTAKINIISYADADKYPNWGNNNRVWKGQNTVELREYSYKENPEDRTITFFFNGSKADTFSYDGLF